eukprot:4887862-Karenia_brevis.AAC.1
MPYLEGRSVSDQSPDIRFGAADVDVALPENDVAVELLRGQNLPRSQRVRLVDQTEEWLEDFIEEVVGIQKGIIVTWNTQEAESILTQEDCAQGFVVFNKIRPEVVARLAHEIEFGFRFRDQVDYHPLTQFQKTHLVMCIQAKMIPFRFVRAGYIPPRGVQQRPTISAEEIE